MSRNEVINAINDLYDDNINLKTNNEILNSLVKANENTVKCEESDSDINLNFKLMEYGKKALAKEMIKDWDICIYVSCDEEGNITTTLYEEWLERKIRTNNIPSNMSLEEVKKAIRDIAYKEYQKEKENQIKKFEEKQKVTRIEEGESKDE